MHERTKAIVRKAVHGDSDPQRVTRLEGDAVARSPGALADEAYAVSMFGGSRAIWIDAQGRDLMPALEPLFARPPADCTIVVRAGPLKKGTPLRTAFEKMTAGASIECYSDEASALEALIKAEARAAELAVTPDAQSALVALLGADRQTTRGELAKLMLYARGKPRIEAEDVEAIVCDAAPSNLDELIDHALNGDLPALEAATTRIFSEGGDPDYVMIRLVAR
ncbi:MAG: DNA polymerase III subunit delta, partial [Candidatus Eremiobacteraeota bacterium]|nr:DNA polymerase III subunit delta [Candidatus Eremiobacteraeota bacterium]